MDTLAYAAEALKSLGYGMIAAILRRGCTDGLKIVNKSFVPSGVAIAVRDAVDNPTGSGESS
ncbi:hypothetical protein [Acidisphaera sp. S103]|uniref:hypothetical protein n=1 Tax=Acidisphaera sp. S103 TaxID=1747223 RepID=UPI00131CFCF1|nr:hypothetical protein [Acidisphaera sp. S103]